MTRRSVLTVIAVIIFSCPVNAYDGSFKYEDNGRLKEINESLATYKKSFAGTNPVVPHHENGKYIKM